MQDEIINEDDGTKMHNAFIKLDDEGYIKDVVYFEGEELEGHILFNDIDNYDPKMTSFMKYKQVESDVENSGELIFDDEKWQEYEDMLEEQRRKREEEEAAKEEAEVAQRFLMNRTFLPMAFAMVADEEVEQVAPLVPQWAPNQGYEEKMLVKREGIFYRVILKHKSQADWLPENTPGLYKALIDNPFEEYPAWQQPQGAYDAYKKGDKVTHNNKRWVSTMDGNVWAPGVHGWEEVTD